MEKKLLILIQGIVGYEWLKSGFEKVFIEKMSGEELVKTLGAFASKNPIEFYKNFLNSFATSNASIFAFLVSWGELLSGLVLLISAVLIWLGKEIRFTKELSILALAVGAFMNLNFWLAAKWMNPAVDSANFIMFVIQIVLLVAWIKVFLPVRSAEKATA
ncbi:MAG: hypothetical protein M1355_01975 [Patescibacteria group bacterium]|nr:hypothetical protein [Patescibacteria group bacterium]